MAFILVLGGLLVLSGISQAGVINGPSSPTQPWKTKVIPYKWLGTDANEYGMLNKAMAQISQDSGYCVNFTDIGKNTVPNTPFLSIQPKFSNSVTNICWTYHGQYLAAGNQGQVLVAFSSNSGNRVGACLDSQRDAMRVLMNALGVRNEFMKSYRSPNNMVFPSTVDRNSLVAPTLQSLNIFADANMYTDPSQAVDATGGRFDAQSITMITPERFAGTSTPVFTVPNNVQVGQLARLSLMDCQTLTSIYGCGSVVCADPYSSSASSMSFTPNPAVIARSLQCSSTSGVTTLPDPGIAIGQLAINGLSVTAAVTTPPTIGQVTSSIPGLQTKLDLMAAPLQQDQTATTGKNEAKTCGTAGGPTGPIPCLYAVTFSLNRLPSAGVTNQQVTININQGTTVIGTLVATININCAPIFQSLTANVGPTPGSVSQITYRLGTEILPVAPPATAIPAAPVYSAVDAGVLSRYVVNYNIPNGVGDAGNPNKAIAPPVVAPKKVYVNCISTAGPTTAIPSIGGSSVIGSIVATDPEGGPVSYYAYSGITTAALAQQHSVTKEGIISISAVVSPNKGVSNANSAPGASPLDENGGAVGSTLRDSDGLLPTDVFIVAVDSLGGSTVLQARFYLYCGEQVA